MPDDEMKLLLQTKTGRGRGDRNWPRALYCFIRFEKGGGGRTKAFPKSVVDASVNKKSGPRWSSVEVEF